MGWWDWSHSARRHQESAMSQVSAQGPPRVVGGCHPGLVGEVRASKAWSRCMGGDGHRLSALREDQPPMPSVGLGEVPNRRRASSQGGEERGAEHSPGRHCSPQRPGAPSARSGSTRPTRQEWTHHPLRTPWGVPGRASPTPWGVDEGEKALAAGCVLRLDMERWVPNEPQPTTPHRRGPCGATLRHEPTA